MDANSLECVPYLFPDGCVDCVDCVVVRRDAKYCVSTGGTYKT